MIINNLKLALQLNNNYINSEINALIAYINNFATNQKILHYEIEKRFDSTDSTIATNNGNLTYQIAQLNTNLTNTISVLHDDYIIHKEDAVRHITAEERTKWNNSTSYLDGTIKDHAENTVIHVTQADKDLWNATLQNAKDFAQSLFNRINSFEIVKCTELPTENIRTMTVYFLQIDPEQNDLYEEYMYIDGKWEKIGNTRIDLSDYATKSMLQTEVDALNNTISNNKSELLAKHNNDVRALDNRVNTNSNNISTLQTNLLALSRALNENTISLSNDIDNLSDKHDSDINDISDRIDDLYNELNTKVNNVHTHNNLQVLDNLTQDVIDNSHTHSNKSILDKFTLNPKNDLLYEDKKIVNEFTEQDVEVIMSYLWDLEYYNILSKDNKYILTKDNKVFIAKED